VDAFIVEGETELIYKRGWDTVSAFKKGQILYLVISQFHFVFNSRGVNISQTHILLFSMVFFFFFIVIVSYDLKQRFFFYRSFISLFVIFEYAVFFSDWLFDNFDIWAFVICFCNTCVLQSLLLKHRYINGHAKLHHEESTNHAVCMDCDNLAVFW
jgi:hypothetical protein